MEHSHIRKVISAYSLILKTSVVIIINDNICFSLFFPPHCRNVKILLQRQRKCGSRWYKTTAIASSCMSATFSCQVHCGGNLEPSKVETVWRILLLCLVCWHRHYWTCMGLWYAQHTCNSVDLVCLTLAADFWLHSFFSIDSCLGILFRATQGEINGRLLSVGNGKLFMCNEDKEGEGAIEHG